MSRFGRNDGSYTRFGLTTIRHWNPCCCMKLETGAKLIAIIQMVIHFASVLSVGVIFIIFQSLQIPTNKDHSDLEWAQSRGPGYLRVLGINGLVWTVYFFLHCYLYKGVKERDYIKVDRYWKVMLWMTLFTLFYTIATMEFVGGFLIGLCDTFDLFLDFYTLWIIHAYRKDLDNGSDHHVEFERVL